MDKGGRGQPRPAWGLLAFFVFFIVNWFLHGFASASCPGGVDALAAIPGRVRNREHSDRLTRAGICGGSAFLDGRDGF